MSYCVNCGVELDPSAKECPLCNTPVINPRDLGKLKAWDTPFPEQKGQVEAVKRKDFGVLLSTVLLATAVTCGILNALVFRGTLWSLAVVGVCAILWVIMIPAVIYVKQPVYLSLFYDGVAVGLYLYLLTFLTREEGWFWGLGLPIVAFVTVVAEVFTLCLRKLPRSFLTVTLYVFTAAGILCIGLEILIARYCTGAVSLSWSAVVLTVCAVLDIALITMLSSKRMRGAVRKRLHF